MENTKNNSQIIIQGYILATDYNRHGKALEIVIETKDFQQYIIAQNQKGKELFDCIYEKVNISGTLSQVQPGGNAILNVKQYEILD